jgi:hypothetical protein
MTKSPKKILSREGWLPKAAGAGPKVGAAVPSGDEFEFKL